MPLAGSVQKLIERATRLADDQPIKVIRATLGELTGLTAAEVQTEFRRRSRDTSAAGAELVLRAEEGRAVCLTCEQAVPVDGEGQACEACGSYRHQVIAGQLLKVEGVSVDRSPTAARRAGMTRPPARTAGLSGSAVAGQKIRQGRAR
jgi:Zn finger protein HypA/HybF involved in hydrogenase expression